MAVVKHEAFFRRHSIFTGEELAAHLASRGNVGERGQEALLAYYTKTGRIVRVRGGLYAVVPPGSDPASYPVDPFLIASRLTKDAVVSHHTALDFHGRAYSAWPSLVYSSSPAGQAIHIPLQCFPGNEIPRSLNSFRRGAVRRTYKGSFRFDAQRHEP